MAYKKFIEQNDVDFTKNLVNEQELAEFEKIAGLSFGAQLKEYILTYGYLGFSAVEFYGVNSKQREKSDLITQTLYLHTYFKKTQRYIAFENIGEGKYILVDGHDNIYSYSSEQDDIQSLGVDLGEYILCRFKSEL